MSIRGKLDMVIKNNEQGTISLIAVNLIPLLIALLGVVIYHAKIVLTELDYHCNQYQQQNSRVVKLPPNGFLAIELAGWLSIILLIAGTLFHYQYSMEERIGQIIKRCHHARDKR
jgi:hypothetical protein